MKYTDTYADKSQSRSNLFQPFTSLAAVVPELPGSISTWADGYYENAKYEHRLLIIRDTTKQRKSIYIYADGTFLICADYASVGEGWVKVAGTPRLTVSLA